jgi:hypothetical protein
MDLALHRAQQAVVGAAGPVRLLAAKRVEAVDKVCLNYTVIDAIALTHHTAGVRMLFFVRCVTGSRLQPTPCVSRKVHM